jgi:hypothetical protein
VSIRDVDVLDHNKILDDVEGEVLGDFLNKFAIAVTRNAIAVCTLVGGAQLCK